MTVPQNIGDKIKGSSVKFSSNSNNCANENATKMSSDSTSTSVTFLEEASTCPKTPATTTGLTETSLSQAINTLERFLKVQADPEWQQKNSKMTDSQQKQLKRLNSIARQVTLNGLKSKHEQRKQLNQLLVERDLTIAESKGIRLLRKNKAFRLKKVFQQQPVTTGAAPALGCSYKLPTGTGTEVVSESRTIRENAPKLLLPSPEQLDTPYQSPFECYICKSYQNSSHTFYDQMCSSCGDFNYLKRTQTASLNGYMALVTGGRIKIGYETSLILLRAGARVIITTRFPTDAAFRYSKETDFLTWKNRLDIYGLDLRFLKMVEAFCTYLNRTYSKLDILIQNAAQTLRRPTVYYQHLLEFEQSNYLEEAGLQDLVKSFEIHGDNCLTAGGGRQDVPVPALPCNLGDDKSFELSKVKSNCGTIATSTTAAPTLSQLVVHPDDKLYFPNNNISKTHFPPGLYDEAHQQLDLRPINTWTLQLDQVDTAELVEVQLVNSIAPFILLNKLTPIMDKSTSVPEASSNSNSPKYGWIIMVSSMEGSFSRSYKTSFHPHTNCAKASLNMIVRTSASYYKSKYNLLLNAVDTGWVTDEDPIPKQATRKMKFHPPIDEVDGAARVLDPIFQTINNINSQKGEQLIYGHFLKDYLPTSW